MKAIVVSAFGPPQVMKLKEVSKPEPGPGQVLVRTMAIGVNPVDTYMRSGAYAAKPELPYIPGTDAAGTIEEVGAEVEELRAGVCVYTAGTESGAYAELVLCQVDQVFPLPEKISFKQGAALNIPYATAWRGLHQRGRALPGETLLVHGASGGVGSAAVQLGAALGMTVFGTAGTERGMKMVREQGAKHVFNHGEEGYLDKLTEQTKGRGVDLILEMLSNVNLARDLTLLAPFGRVVVIGCRGTIEINPREAMMRDADIRGMILNNASPEERRRIHSALGAGLLNGTIRPVVGREFPLEEAAQAHEAVLQPGALGKIVLLPERDTAASGV